MKGIVSEWVLGLTCTSAIAGIAIAVTPNGKVKTAVRFICGLLILIAFIKPILSFKPEALAEIIVEYKAEAGIYSERFKETNYRIMKEIIESDAAAYILDKAEKLGIQGCSVSLSAIKGDDDYPYPHEVWVTAYMTEAQKSELSGYISNELGIRRDKQHWGL